MKKTLLAIFASALSLSAFATTPTTELLNQTETTLSQEPNAPWDRLECRAMDVWGRVFTATGHAWRSSRATQLQNEAMDQCSQYSGLNSCRPLGCIQY